MAKISKKTSRQVKTKKKKWYPVISPDFMGSKQVGDTYAVEVSDAVGKKVHANLMQITGDMKNQNISLKLEITNAKEGKLQTKLLSVVYSPSSIKRYVRRRMSRIDDSIVVKSKDGLKIRVKPFILTRSRVSRAVSYTIRASARKQLKELALQYTFNEFVEQVLKKVLQKELKGTLGKIYPIKIVEIRMVHETSSEAKEADDPKRIIVKSKKTEEVVDDEGPVHASKKQKESSDETSVETSE